MPKVISIDDVKVRHLSAAFNDDGTITLLFRYEELAGSQAYRQEAYVVTAPPAVASRARELVAWAVERIKQEQGI